VRSLALSVVDKEQHTHLIETSASNDQRRIDLETIGAEIWVLKELLKPCARVKGEVDLLVGVFVCCLYCVHCVCVCVCVCVCMCVCVYE
jgi:hypothetical protein